LKKTSLLILLICCSFSIKAQDDNITFKTGKYVFNSVYDTAEYCSILTITNSGSQIYKSDCSDKISAISEIDFEGAGKKKILIEYYTGGAHCCNILNIGELRGNSFVFLDSLYLGNAGYEIKDLDKDGELEIVSSNDMFAYAFTNYAQSRFPIAIYKFQNNKFHFVNEDYENEVLAHVKELKSELNEYKSFDCPKDANEDTFNTDAGAVKALLAPILADYFSIGRSEEGYNFIKSFYKCTDRDNFIKILKNDFKLK
jgi:hypothetical protein